jgi:RHS repeat-associated protein
MATGDQMRPARAVKCLAFRSDALLRPLGLALAVTLLSAVLLLVPAMEGSVPSVWASPPARTLLAAGDDGKLATSTDGVNWTQRPSAVSAMNGQPIRGAAYSGELNRWVIVGGINYLATSDDDGVTWTRRVGGHAGGGFNGTIYDVVWSPELDLFVSVGDLGRRATSPDGITWTQRTSGEPAHRIQAVDWSPSLGLFVAWGTDTVDVPEVVDYSADGINWYPASGPSGLHGEMQSVEWAPGLGLFVGTSNSNAYVSANGAAWSAPIPVGLPSNLLAVAWSGDLGQLVATAATGGLATSSDGVTWTSRTSSFGSDGIQDAEWSPSSSIWVAVGSQGKLATSTDGANWSQQTSSFGTTLIRTVAWKDTRVADYPLEASEFYGSNAALRYQCPCRQATDHSIDTHTGNEHFTLPGIDAGGRGPGLSVDLAYNSGNSAASGTFGNGWSSTYDMSLTLNGDGTRTVRQETGATVRFWEDGGVWEAPDRVQASLSYASGTWTFTRGHLEIFEFGGDGKLTSIKDRNGYAATIFRDGSGRVDYVEHSDGRRLDFTYLSAPERVTITDPLVAPSTRTVTATLSSSGDLVEFADVNSGEWALTYSAHKLTSVRSPRHASAGSPQPVFEYHYDAQGRTDWEEDELDRRTTLFYDDPAPGATRRVSPDGDQRVDFYVDGALSKTTFAYGTADAYSVAYVYDPFLVAPITMVVDPGGQNLSWSYEYDSAGNRSKTTDPAGHVTSATYNTFDQPLTVTDGRGVVTSNTYDANGNLELTSTASTNPSGSRVVDLVYGDAAHPGDVTSIVDERSKTRSFTYDSYGFFASSTSPSPDLDKTTFVNDQIGRVTETVAPKGNVTGGTPANFRTTFTYDGYGNVLTTSGPAGAVAREYWPGGLLKKVTDQSNQATSYAYDLAGGLTGVTRPDSSVLGTEYFADGTVKAQIDGASARTEYTYDTANRLKTTKDPLNRVTTFGYDTTNRLVSKQLPGGNCATPTDCVKYEYFADGTLKKIDYSDTTPDVSYTYDANERPLTMSDGTGATASWVWDDLGRLTSYTDVTGAVSYGYAGLSGIVSSITYPGNKTVTRRIDNSGRFDQLTDWASRATEFDFDPNGNIDLTTLPTATTNTDDYVYDNADRLTGVTYKKGATTLGALTFARSHAEGFVTGTSGSGVPSPTQSFGYNDLDFLNTFNANTVSYDTADNLTGLPGGPAQRFDAGNQLCYQAATNTNGCGSPPSGAATFAYDSRGNRTSTVTPGAEAVPTVALSHNAVTNTNTKNLTGVTTAGNLGVLVANISAGGSTAPSAPTGWTLATSKKHTAANTYVAIFYRVLDGTEGSTVIGNMTTGNRGIWYFELASTNNGTWTVDATVTNQVTTATSISTGAASNIRPAVSIAGAEWTTSLPTTSPAATWNNAWTRKEYLRYQGTTGYKVHGSPGSQSSTISIDTLNPRSMAAAQAIFSKSGTTAQTTSLSYDQANRLTTSTAAAATTTYTYAGDGLRIKKQAADGTTTLYTWDRTDSVPQLLQETISAAGQTTKYIRYLYGPDGTVTQDITSVGATDTPRWYHHDHLGSTRALTDLAGNTVGAATYTAHGQLAGTTGVTTAIGWAGEYRDSETGFTYLRARYYDPSTGVFLTRDPIESTTREPYHYAGNNPANLTDPLGLYWGEGMVKKAAGTVTRAAEITREAAQDIGEAAWRNRDAIAAGVAIASCAAATAGSAGAVAGACGLLTKAALAMAVHKAADENHVLPGNEPANWGGFAIDGTLAAGGFIGGAAAARWLKEGTGALAYYLRTQRPDAKWLFWAYGAFTDFAPTWVSSGISDC